MSRPNSSAPSRYLPPGLARFSIRVCRVGSSGASHGASAALSASTTTSARPSSASRFRQKRLHALAVIRWSSLASHAWIEQAVGEIDQEVDDDEGEREDEDGPLQQDVVAREDRLHHQTAEPG